MEPLWKKDDGCHGVGGFSRQTFTSQALCGFVRTTEVMRSISVGLFAQMQTNFPIKPLISDEHRFIH